MLKKISMIACAVVFLFSCTDNAESNENLNAENHSLIPEVSSKAAVKEGYYQGKKITYIREDGINYWGGDMILGDNEISDKPQPENRASGIDSRKWPNATIYYKFYNGNSTQRNTFKTATAEWTKKTNLKFVDITSYSLNRVGYHIAVYFNQTGNNSQVGFQNTGSGSTPGQRLNLSSNLVGVILHELGHAIGMEHEHQRSDRDDHININFNNLRPEFRTFFNTKDSYVNRIASGFDHLSIMNYASKITDPKFVFNTSINTLTRKDGTGWPDPNFRTTVTDTDAGWVKFIYGI